MTCGYLAGGASIKPSAQHSDADWRETISGRDPLELASDECFKPSATAPGTHDCAQLAPVIMGKANTAYLCF